MRRDNVACISLPAQRLLLEEKLSGLSRLMRCSRHSGVILYSNENDHYVVYTSPPPTAEPLLKEKPFGGCSCQLAPIIALGFRTQLSSAGQQTAQLSLILSLYAPRYCHTASAGFGRQFAKLRALSRLQRRYGSKKESSPSFHCSPRPRFTHSQATGISPECSPKCHRAAREREATHPRLCRKAVRQPRA